MANIDNVQLPDGSSYNIVDNTSGFATQNYVDSAVASVTKTTIGLGNVDNTSDLNKPISTATQTALDTLDEGKADKTDIASVESTSTASQAHAKGSQFYFNGQLVTATANISIGGTITPNGNCVASDSITGQISNLKGKLIYTANANKKYSEQFAILEPYFDALTDEQKSKSYLVVGTNLVFRLSQFVNKAFMNIYMGPSGCNLIQYSLGAHSFIQTYVTTNGTTIADYSNSNNTQTLSLYVM